MIDPCNRMVQTNVSCPGCPCIEAYVRRSLGNGVNGRGSSELTGIMVGEGTIPGCQPKRRSVALIQVSEIS